MLQNALCIPITCSVSLSEMAKDFQGEKVLCRNLLHKEGNSHLFLFFLNSFHDSLRSSLQSCHFVAVDGFADSQVSEMICEVLHYVIIFFWYVVQIYTFQMCSMQIYIFWMFLQISIFHMWFMQMYIFIRCVSYKCIFADVFYANTYFPNVFFTNIPLKGKRQDG